MRNEASRHIRWLVVAAAFFMAVVTSVQSYTGERMQAHPDTLLQVAAPAFAIWGTWLLLAPLVLRLAGALPVRRGRLHATVPLHLLAATGCALVVAGMVAGVDRLVLPATAAVPIRRLVLSGFLFQYHLHLIVYGALLVGREAHAYYRRVGEQTRSALELRAALVDAQLTALREQLQPHFLFNTLHAVGALIDEDPAGARRMIARIGDLLRVTLDGGDVQEVALSAELRLLRLYLEIEEVRFQDRLTVTFEVEPATAGAGVPPFVLQPLVENALRHGIAQRPGPGRIRVSVRRAADRLVLDVWNDNSKLAADAGVGLGLRNTRERLHHLYGDSATLLLAPAADGVLARIEMPYRVLEASTSDRAAVTAHG